MTTSRPAPAADRELRSLDDLIAVLAAPERPRDEWRIGAESEKFGVHEATGAPLQYEGEFGVLRIFEWLMERQGWAPVSESPGGPVIALSKGGANITLEPGAQFELSGAPLRTVHEVVGEHGRHLQEIGAIAREMGVAWLMTGFHPLARQEQLPWVPKQRYSIMREYLPQQGDGALDMMRRTATVQGNFDWSSEADGMAKLRLALKISPLLHAWFANAPFREGAPSGWVSLRGDVWLRMDPRRSGLVARVLDNPSPSYVDYVEWALDAGMFLIKRGDQILHNTGQPFRDFLEHGFEGQRATVADWKLHLNTLFPEARLKGTLEVRSADCLPPDLAGSLLALWTGVLYDARALERAAALTETWTARELEAARGELVRRGLEAQLCGRSGWEWAEQLVEIAAEGLERRGQLDPQGRSEAVLLAPARALLSERRCPAERSLARFEALCPTAPRSTDSDAVGPASTMTTERAIIESTRLSAQ